MLKITKSKVVDGVTFKMKNRRMRIERFSDGGYLIMFKKLFREFDGTLVMPIERIRLTEEAFERLIAGGQMLILNKIKSRRGKKKKEATDDKE